MKTFNIIHSGSGKTFICEARKMNENEKTGWAEWFCEKAAICMQERIELPFIKWNELPKHDDHTTHSLIGDSHDAVEISDEEKEYYINLNRQRQEAQEAKEKAEREAFEKKLQAEKEEKENALIGVKWDIEENIISDEGGKTKGYTHTLTINGNTYIFKERDVFDFGRVINPAEGGLVSKVNGQYVIEDLVKGQGWEVKRSIDGDELKAYLIVEKYGKYANAGIRM